ncbi:MAG: DUF5683 domain-containing protein [Bacteroidia bacterium]
MQKLWFLNVWVVLARPVLSDTLRSANPRLAAWLSGLLPGAGQLYNGSVWKAPLVWAYLGVTGFLAYQAHQQYLYYRQAYRHSLTGQVSFPTLLPENLRFLRESYRRDRDVYIVLFLLGYISQIGDAYVEAHLKGFRIYARLRPDAVQLALGWR